MALLIDSATPAGSDSPTAGDDQIRAFKLAVRDIFTIPNNTTIATALGSVSASGLQYWTFNNEAADAAAAGRLQRNAAILTWHDGTAVRQLLGGDANLTANGIVYGTAAARATATAALTNGQMIIGSTGAAPALGTITGNGITVGTGAGTLSLTAAPTRSTQDVTTSETTTSVSYTDLATVGPAVTLTPGRTTDQIIFVSARIANNTGGQDSYISPAIAGAAASDVDAFVWAVAAANYFQRGSSHTLAASVADGSTHTAKYRVAGGTGTFVNRRISAFTLT